MLKKNNIQKCISWCQKYNVPYNKTLGNYSSNIFLSNHNLIFQTYDTLENIFLSWTQTVPEIRQQKI